MEFLSTGSALPQDQGSLPAPPSSSARTGAPGVTLPHPKFPLGSIPTPWGPSWRREGAAPAPEVPQGPALSVAGGSWGLGRGIHSISSGPALCQPGLRSAKLGCGDASPAPAWPEEVTALSHTHTHTHKVTPVCFCVFISTPQTADPCACPGMSWNVLYTLATKILGGRGGRARPQSRAWPIPWNSLG